MHQTRQELTPKVPLARKGTKYVARALNHHRNSVPIVIALRDMLHLARTAREVNEMIKQKMLKLNGKIVTDYRESIRLFNLLEAGKNYRLTLLPTGKFTFEPVSEKEGRLCKVLNKTLAAKDIFQLHLHDGTTLLTKEKIIVGDSLVLDEAGKIKKHLPLIAGKKVLVITGSYAGTHANIKTSQGKTVTVSFANKEATLDKQSVIVL